MARDEVDVLEDQDVEDQEVEDTEDTGEETEDTDDTEAAADSATDEATEAPSEPAPEKPEGPSAEEIQAALDSFLSLAESVVEDRDQATGELPAEAIVRVKTAYANLPVTAAKTKARAGLSDRMKSALATELDAGKARAFMTLEGEVKTTAGTRETIARAPVDPTVAFVERVTTLYLSSSMLEVPADVSPDWSKQVQDLGNALGGEIQSYKEYLRSLAYWNAQPENSRGDAPVEPEVSVVVKNAARVAHGRGLGGGTRRTKTDGATPRTSTSTYTGPRRHVKSHIQSAFNGKPAGTFLKISEIAGHTSNEYGDDHPSSGAVSAALFPSSGKDVTDLEGIEPAEQGGVKGARKVA